MANKAGDIKRADEIGFNGRHLYIWMACIDCGRERWVDYIVKKSSPRTQRCHHCAMNTPESKAKHANYCRENNGKWKGGRRKMANGYIEITLSKTDTFANMAAACGRISEHRLVMARYLNRPLLRSEHVHHKNGLKDDNRIENLELISPENHKLYKTMCANCDLRKQIRLLQWEVRELRLQLKPSLQGV